MKFFAFIMAFQVLALSILPCADEGIVMKASVIKTEMAKQHDQQEEDHHDDACSPFCHCTCCAGFSINHFFTSTSLLIIRDKTHTSYLPGDLIEYSSPVWQPPQLRA